MRENARKNVRDVMKVESGSIYGPDFIINGLEEKK